MEDLSLPREGETAREKILLAPRSRPWVFGGGDRHDRRAVYSPRPRPAEIWSPMPPSATDSLLSPLSLSYLELILGLVVLSDAPRRTGLECKVRGCCSSRTRYVRYALCGSRRKILQQCWRSLLPPRLDHSTVVFFLRGDASLSPSWTFRVGVSRAPVAAAADSRTLHRI